MPTTMTPETFTLVVCGALLLWFLWPAIRAIIGPSVARVIAVRNERLYGSVMSNTEPPAPDRRAVSALDGPETETGTETTQETAPAPAGRYIDPELLYRALRAEGITREAGKRICRRIDFPLNTNAWAAARPEPNAAEVEAELAPNGTPVLNIRTNAATYAVIGENVHA